MEPKYTPPTEYNGRPIRLTVERCEGICVGCVFDHAAPRSNSECMKAMRNHVCDGMIFVYDDPGSRIADAMTTLIDLNRDIVKMSTRMMEALKVVADNLTRISKEEYE